MRGKILTTSYWLHVELGKNVLKILCKKIKWHLIFEVQFFKLATLSHNLVGKISPYFKNTLLYKYHIL
jgi:hypothetical protein